MEQIEEEKLIQNCDAVLWVSKETEDEIVTVMQFFKSKKEETVKPTDMGFKYNIMMFKKLDEVETFTAIIGDPFGYVNRIGKIGYHGMMYKKSAMHTKDFTDFVATVMNKWGFHPNEAKRLMNLTVN